MIVASRQDLPEVAVRMFSHWRQENYFKYARTHFGLERRVPNPARKRLKQELTRIEDALVKLQAENAELGLPREKRACR